MLRYLAAVTVVSAAVVASGCGSSDNDKTTSGGGGNTSANKGGKIALLLPETKTARYETQDRPLFEAKAKQLCPKCEILYSNADQDAAKQQQQAEAALTQGAKVLVLDAVDAASAGAIVTRAKQQTSRSSAMTGSSPTRRSTTTSRSTTCASGSFRARRWPRSSRTTARRRARS
jgi:ABC-type sugar transport system substrate-binding protein